MNFLSFFLSDGKYWLKFGEMERRTWKFNLNEWGWEERKRVEDDRFRTRRKGLNILDWISNSRSFSIWISQLEKRISKSQFNQLMQTAIRRTWSSLPFYTVRVWMFSFPEFRNRNVSLGKDVDEERHLFQKSTRVGRTLKNLNFSTSINSIWN